MGGFGREGKRRRIVVDAAASLLQPPQRVPALRAGRVGSCGGGRFRLRYATELEIESV